MRQISMHRFYYIFLFVVEGCFAATILLSKGDRERQILLVIFAAVFYAIWGIVHHKNNHDFHTKIVIEYVLMAILGIAIMFFLLQ
ncbi:MAG: hypothetical protein HZC02_04010 [Candidatus Levybacteria bacterium]|nr:hypothetical protein [Candidatus Levybacteria bacterium]